MNKNMIVGIAVAMGMLSAGALSASAAVSCCGDSQCSDKQAHQQFTKETAALSSALKAKDIKLRELALSGTYDTWQAAALETDLKELKAKINTVAVKHGISACCRS
ncbi:MAG: hypothetical protein H7Y05_05815 [Steroidobacteraceae bacterium]|nr:hypothetical protein [Deltaproteobacteria bacterium]